LGVGPGTSKKERWRGDGRSQKKGTSKCNPGFARCPLVVEEGSEVASKESIERKSNLVPGRGWSRRVEGKELKTDGGETFEVE